MDDLFHLHLSKTDNLLKTFGEIHDCIYANDGLSPQQTLEEFVKILFIKTHDENHRLNQFTITASECNAIKSGKDNGEIRQRITKLFDKTKKFYGELFDEDERIKLSPVSLGFTIDKLQNIALFESSKDAKGLAFQKFLSHYEKGAKGQFFTPEPVIDFCVKMLNPQKHDIIIDPACGSGGFLISALMHLKENNENISPRTIVKKQLFGVDINKSIARIARMKLMLEGNCNTNIFCDNTLGNWKTLHDSFNHKGVFDVVLANPPFGGQLSNESMLSNFDLGHRWTSENNIFRKTKHLNKTQSVEVLYIERCLQLLKDGGKMAIVLPNGNFENSSLEYVRYYIKNNAKILAVVNLPQETFIPYGTGVKTSLLFLQKTPVSSASQHSIFFAKITKLGYQGNKNGTPIYKKDKHGQIMKDTSKNAIIDEDFTLIAQCYDTFISKGKILNDHAYSMSHNKINGRLDYNFYDPNNEKILRGFNDKNSVRLGDICDIVKTESKKIRVANAVVKYVELSDINTHSNEITHSTSYNTIDLPSRASYRLKTSDIITAVSGNSVGTRKHATALVDKEFEGMICTNGFRVLRNIKLDIYYFLYFLNTKTFLQQIYRYRTGAAIPCVADSDLSQILVFTPPDDIQISIGKKMKKAMELRLESKRVIENLRFEDMIHNNISI